MSCHIYKQTIPIYSNNVNIKLISGCYKGQYKLIPDSKDTNKYIRIKHGHGVWIGANGDKYDGEFKYNKKHGHGIYTWASGSKYDGNFKDNKKHGHGVQTFANGDKYDGKWKGGKRHGHGVKTFANGDKYDGE